MKRFLLTITFLFLVSSSFAVDYGLKLFSWNSTYKEVVSFFMNNGWSMSLDNGLLTFDVPANENYYYQNKLLKIKNVSFGFDKDGNIHAQTIMFDNDYTASIIFMALLSAAVNDNATLYDEDYKTQDNNVDNLYYSAHLPDNIDADYMIVGKDDYYMFCISYYKL